MADKRLERLSTTEITKMTEQDFLTILKDVNRCGDCSECLGEGIFLRDNITLRNNEIIECCRTFYMEKVVPELIMRLSANEPQFNSTPETPEETSKELSHSQTIQFMKNRGYTHCYMCGSDLCKE